MCASLNGKNQYVPEPATIISNEKMTPLENLFTLKMDSGKSLGHKAGQFVEVSLPGIGEAPISVSSSPLVTDTFELGVRKVGNVTFAMHNMKPGDKVGIRGPFGTDFPVDSVLKGKNIVYISGGCGLVPLRSAIKYTLEKREDYKDITILFGCKSFKERLYVNELESWAQRGDVTLQETIDVADEKWKGNVGLITTLLPQIRITDMANTYLVLCGPPIMYKFVLKGLEEMGVPESQIYVSLERRMKCGLGKCGHCQINGKYACQEGAVFNLSDLKGVKEAFV